MKNVIRMMCLVVIVAGLGSAASAVTIETVRVGNAGNVGEQTQAGLTTYFGGVAYEYNIGKYEVTAGQYTEFLNAVAATDTHGLYYYLMGFPDGIQRTGSSGSYSYSVSGGYANRPANYVSWGDAARFANWLHNGQPTGAQGPGTTEDGAYDLIGASVWTVSRELDWKWAITSEDEWYKAAYYDPSLNSGAGGYYDYPTGSDTVPTGESPPGGANSANFGMAANGPTDVGAYTSSDSPYGTFDQSGNLWEWNETIMSGPYRGVRGGSFQDSEQSHVSNRAYNTTTNEFGSLGFRVSQVPEPATMAVLTLGGLAVLRRRRKR